MLTHEENERLTRVEGDAPMGRMMKENYWVPFMRDAALKPGGDPKRVRLFGNDHVVFRAEDGRIGMFDEACPHRRASLVLARSEDCALRCIFHGWKIDVEGNVIDMPTNPEDGDVVAPKVTVRKYPVHAEGGLLWAWLGEGEQPAFPDLPWAGLPDEHMWITVTTSNCNWLQGVEGTLDSAHIGQLHGSWMRRLLDDRKAMPQGAVYSDRGNTILTPPRYEVALSPTGLRAAALREMPGGRTHLRLTEYAMPFICMPPLPGDMESQFFISVPIDDVTHLLIFAHAYKTRPVLSELNGSIGNGDYDQDAYANFRGSRENNWGQNRKAMREENHFTGFTRNLLEEDVVVQVSMGPITDRTKEFLVASDLAVVRNRQMLLQVLRKWEENGALPPGSARSGKVTVPHAKDLILEPGEKWTERPEVKVAAE